MATPHVLGFKEFDKAVCIFDNSLLSIDVNRTFEIAGEEAEEEDTEEFDAPMVIFEEFVKAATGTSESYLRDVLHKFLNYTKKVPINDQRELYSSDAAQHLYEIAASDNYELAILSFGIMLNITANSDKEYDPYNNVTFLDFMTSFFQEGINLNIIALSLACLANYSSNNNENRDACISRLTIPYLKELFERTDNKYVRQEIMHLVYTYTKFVLDESIGVELIVFCNTVLSNRVDYCYKYALWSLLYVIKTNEQALDAVYTSELLMFINEVILPEGEVETVGPSLTLLALFIECGKEIPEMQLRNITTCFICKNDFVQRQAINVCSLLISAIPATIPLFLRSGFFRYLTTLLGGEAKYITKLDAAHLYCSYIIRGGTEVVENVCLCKGASQLITFIGYDDRDVTIHAINALCEVFRCSSLIEPRLYRSLLSNIKSFGGFELMEELQDNEDIDIASAADEFKSTYLDDLDVDDIASEDDDFDDSDDSDEDNDDDEEDEEEEEYSN